MREQADLNEILGGEGGYGARPQVFISRGKHGSYPVGGVGEMLLGNFPLVYLSPRRKIEISHISVGRSRSDPQFLMYICMSEQMYPSFLCSVRD